MKLRITLKDPDGIDVSVNECVSMSFLGCNGTLTEEYERCLNAVEDEIRTEIKHALVKWVEHNEYVTIEIDTQTGTAIVIPVGN